MIQFFHVSKLYPGGQAALEDVSFDIPRGQFIFLTGASGAGKTTLLRLIFREEIPSGGQIVVNGRNVASIPTAKIPYLRRTIGVVFQDFRLIPRKTVFENVSYLPRILGFDARRGLTPRDFLARVHPDDRARLKALVRGVIPERPSYSVTFRFKHPDGRDVWLEETARAEFDSVGSLARLNGLTLDVTARRRSEQQQSLLIGALDQRVKTLRHPLPRPLSEL